MDGWTVGDILQYAFLFICLVVIGYAGISGSIVHRLFFKEHSPKEKTLKLLRWLSIIGVVVLVVCIIASVLL